jgi:hypothetical protein
MGRLYLTSVPAVQKFAGLADDYKGLKEFGHAVSLGALEPGGQGIGGDGAGGGFQRLTQRADLVRERGRPWERWRVEGGGWKVEGV